MSDTDVSEARDLLRRLARNDEQALRAVLTPVPEFAGGDAETRPCPERPTRGLVRLAALLTLGACAESLRWAVELASATGVDDEAVTSVLIATGPAAGSAQLVASASQLALALELEPEPLEDDKSRPTGPVDRRRTRGRRPRTSMRHRACDTRHALGS